MSSCIGIRTLHLTIPCVGRLFRPGARAANSRKADNRRRWMAELGFESPRQVCLVRETTARRHLSYREFSPRQHLDSPRQASLQHEGVRRHADRIAKSAGEMRAADPRDGAELDELKVTCQIRFDVVDHASSLDRNERFGKAAPDRSRGMANDDAIHHRLPQGVEVKLRDRHPPQRDGLISLRQMCEPNIDGRANITQLDDVGIDQQRIEVPCQELRREADRQESDRSLPRAAHLFVGTGELNRVHRQKAAVASMAVVGHAHLAIRRVNDHVIEA
jgi:hypothetical protein